MALRRLGQFCVTAPLAEMKKRISDDNTLNPIDSAFELVSLKGCSTRLRERRVLIPDILNHKILFDKNPRVS